MILYNLRVKLVIRQKNRTRVHNLKLTELVTVAIRNVFMPSLDAQYRLYDLTIQ